ncbi:MAG: phosphodiester glycosidase family protein [Cyclonatronaceae bacterium]
MPVLQIILLLLQMLQPGQVVPVVEVFQAVQAGQNPVVVTDTLAPGLVHYHITDSRGPWNINVLEANLANPSVRLKVVKAASGDRESLYAMERTSSMTRRYAEKTRVGGAVNADFYNMENGAPVNMHISDGVPLRRPTLNPGRSVFMMFEDGTPDIRVPEMQIRLRLRSANLNITGLNEARMENGLVLYNSYYGNSTGSNRYGTEVMLRLIDEDRSAGRLTLVADSIFRDSGNTAIRDGYYVLSAHGSSYNGINRSVSAGDTVRVSYHYNSERTIAQAAGGLPKIVCDGADCVDASAEKESVRRAFITTRHPRTAVGISENRDRIFLVTVDGRQQTSTGMSLYELASLMVDLGAWHALNLDGGGSTTLVTGTKVANLPSDPTGERPVSNAIIILIDDE